MAENLLFLAGQRAYKKIRSNGLQQDNVKMVVGASGAAKWLVLHGLESALFGTWFKDRSEPLHLYGTSIGSWKSAAAARQDPVKGFDTLAQAYIHQYYSGKITQNQVMRESDRIMNEFLGAGVADEILNHPFCRLHLSAVRCTGLLASDNDKIELLGLVVAWLINRISRNLFRRMCKPTLFYHPLDPPPFLHSGEFCGGEVLLGPHNLRQALLASGSIPCVMKSVKDVDSAVEGAYRDGGLYHYHPAFDFMAGEKGITLYPHFYDHAILGWLDKNRQSRIADGRQLADVLILAPSPEFIKTLPFGRIPDRKDFVRLAGKDKVRVDAWLKTVQLSATLGQEFLNAVDSGSIREKIRRIP